MKKSNNKVLIIMAVVLLNVLVLYMIGQSLLGKESKYDLTLAEARSYAEQELCSKSITKYNEVLVIKDSLSVRLEMLDVYEKGMDIGEFTNSYDIFSAVSTMVEKYREDAIAYEEACTLFLKYSKYEECAKTLMLARDLHVTSDKIEDFRKQVRYQYTKYFAMYTDVLPSYNGMYTVATDGNYTFLNDEASPVSGGTFLAASSFSEGYAFVKVQHVDGKERGIIVNKDGERQAYLDEVESSSGVGAAKDKDGNRILLLSGKTGGKYKYYNIEGKEVFGDYAFAGRFRNNVAAVMESEGKWKLIDGTGKAIVDKTFSDVVLNEFDECAPKGLIIAKEGNKYHIYDINGNRVSDFSCDGAKAFVDDYAAFQLSGQWGFVGADGKVLISPQYDDAKSFSNSMGAVKNDEGWMFINPENEIVIQETFEDVDYLNDKGICFVKSNGYWCYLKMYYTGK